jgi:hypothetical protein
VETEPPAHSYPTLGIIAGGRTIVLLPRPGPESREPSGVCEMNASSEIMRRTSLSDEAGFGSALGKALR